MMNYTTVQRKIVTGATPGIKHLAVISRNGVMTQDQLIERISGASALAENDVLSALRAFQVTITDAVMNGITVHLNEFGIFAPYLNSTAMLTAEEVDVSTIKGVNIRFKPNVKFKNKLKTVYYEYRNPAPKGLVAPAQ